MELESLCNRNILEHRKVYIGVTRTIVLVPSNVSERICPYPCRARGDCGRELARCRERCRVDPLHPWDRQVELSRDAERIADQVQARENFIVRLSGVEFPDATRLPSIEDIVFPASRPLRLWHGISETRRK